MAKKSPIVPFTPAPAALPTRGQRTAKAKAPKMGGDKGMNPRAQCTDHMN